MNRRGRRGDKNVVLRGEALMSQNQEISSRPRVIQHMERMGLLSSRKQGGFRSEQGGKCKVDMECHRK